MNTLIKRYGKILTILAGLILFPLVYAAIVFLVLASPIKTTTLASQMGVVFLIFIFYIVDAGKTVFLSYVFLALSISVLVLSTIIYKKRVKVFRFFPFYYFLMGLLVLLHFASEGILIEGYVPALKPKDRVKHWVIDYPRKGFDNLYRSVLADFEGIDGRYEIVGWLNNEILLYKKQEGSRYHLGPEQIRQFDTTKNVSSKYVGAIDKVGRNTCKYQDCVQGLVETSYSAMGQCQEAIVSPDNRKLACLTKYTYGPEDIIVFEK